MGSETERIRNLVIVAKQTLVEIPKCIGIDRQNALILDLAMHLRDIDEANEARDKSHDKPKLTAVIEVPDLSTDMCRGLLEIGFDTALSAVVPQIKTVRFKNADYSNCERGGTGGFGTGMCSWNPPENPFRRASTTVKEPETCRACKHSLAADGMCHSIGCRCDCTRGCDCRADDVAQGIHFNECTTDRPWKKVKHVGVAEHGPTPEKVPVIFSGPHCTCGYDHGDLGSDGLCVRCGGQVSP